MSKRLKKIQTSGYCHSPKYQIFLHITTSHPNRHHILYPHNMSILRDFIDKKEGKLPVIRFIGFCLILLGLSGMIIGSFLDYFDHEQLVPGIISIAFFIIMFGFSIAFPSLLEGREGLSTMRIVVFMVTNVICMILLKLAWSRGITSLEQIKLDQYWVGIIAFTFGAKATQSFFESKLAVPKPSENIGAAALSFSNAEIARLAVLQNEPFLKVKFPNIVTVSDSITDSSKPDSHVIALYLKDANTLDIPNSLEVKMPDGTIKVIQTQIIKGMGTARVHYSQLDTSLAGSDFPNYVGSICCGVKSGIPGNNFRGVVTSAHIYTKGSYSDSFNGLLNPIQQTPVLLNGNQAAQWYYKMLNFSQDLAVAKLNPGEAENANYKVFNDEYYDVEDKDVLTAAPNITMLARDNKTRTGFIIDYNIGMEIGYDFPVFKNQLILIGSTNNKNTSLPISVEGDSGCCIYHTESGKLIGILLGGNEKYSMVLPIADTLKTLNLKTI